MWRWEFGTSNTRGHFLLKNQSLSCFFNLLSQLFFLLYHKSQILSILFFVYYIYIKKLQYQRSDWHNFSNVYFSKVGSLVYWLQKVIMIRLLWMCGGDLISQKSDHWYIYCVPPRYTDFCDLVYRQQRPSISAKET